MAVPPDAAKVIFLAVIKSLEGKKYEFVEPNLTKYLRL
jgi:hypothetical protein